MSLTGQNLQKLLNTILNSFTELCNCDAGSIFTIRKVQRQELQAGQIVQNTRNILMFETMITKSIRLYQVPEHLQSLQFEIDENTLVGKTALNRQVFNVLQPKKTTSVESLLQYTTQNILSAPLVTPRGDLVGVVQLLNKYEVAGNNHFDERDQRLLTIVAGQAALAIENSLLLEEQEKLLEGFVNACVTAVEARDPVTSGHSVRVADYSVGLSIAVSRTTTGNLRDLYFTENQLREIRYASMLHDIGKISVREQVLNKEKKLFPWELEMVRMRLKLMRSNLKLQQEITKKDYREPIEKLKMAWKMIETANEPSILPLEVSNLLADLQHLQIETEDGEILTALNSEEGFKLSVPKGTLTIEERFEIERHVVQTYEILKMVPWSKGLELVPEIAHKHHEKLDGSGYPHHIHHNSIPIQSRMLTICDIFDALTADDRPYKRAVPRDKALDILYSDVKKGQLDNDLFQVFVEAKIFEIGLPSREKKAA